MVHVLGGAQTDFERNWKKEGKNLVALLKEVINDGFKETGLTFDELKRFILKKVWAFKAYMYIWREKWQ